MKFTTITAALAAVASVNAAAITPKAEAKEAHVEKRVILATILTAAATAAVTQAATLAVDAAVKLISEVSDWTDAREAFTQATVKGMWENNPDPSLYVAAICYNMGYGFQNDKHSGVTSVKLDTGKLDTDYDCMYLEAGNSFYTWGDGGYINYAFYASNQCNYQEDSGDLWC